MVASRQRPSPSATARNDPVGVGSVRSGTGGGSATSTSPTIECQVAAVPANSIPTWRRTTLCAPSQPTTYSASTASGPDGVSMQTSALSADCRTPVTSYGLRTGTPSSSRCSLSSASVLRCGWKSRNGYLLSRKARSSRLERIAKCEVGADLPAARNRCTSPRIAKSSTVLEYIVSALDSGNRSARFSSTRTSAPPRCSSAASHMPTGPAPAITTSYRLFTPTFKSPYGHMRTPCSGHFMRAPLYG
jgi:hypothetical protein